MRFIQYLGVKNFNWVRIRRRVAGHLILILDVCTLTIKLFCQNCRLLTLSSASFFNYFRFTSSHSASNFVLSAVYFDNLVALQKYCLLKCSTAWYSTSAGILQIWWRQCPCVKQHASGSDANLLDVWSSGSNLFANKQTRIAGYMYDIETNVNALFYRFRSNLLPVRLTIAYKPFKTIRFWRVLNRFVSHISRKQTCRFISPLV